MIDTIGGILLVLAPALPLLLALPALRRALPGFEAIAALPLLGLVVFPREARLEIPWLLLGESGFALDAGTRAWLALTLAPWLLALWLLRRGSPADGGHGYWSPWHLLALGGQAGAVLATDMTVFFAFSAIMGYAIVGLLFAAPGATLQRAGRCYLAALIVADLLLFEALAMVAAAGGALAFAAVAQGAQGPAGGHAWFYLAFAAFMLRAGLWPAHSWLTLADRHGGAPTSLLLWGGPVLIAVFGIQRWMPPPGLLAPAFGWILLGLGVAAAASTVLRASRAGRAGGLVDPTIGAIAAVFVLAIGSAVLHPDSWPAVQRALVYFFAAAAIALAFAAVARSATRAEAAPTQALETEPRPVRFAAALLDILRRASETTLARACAGFAGAIRRHWRDSAWRQWVAAVESLLQLWQVALAIFLLLATAAIFFGIAASRAG